jgi:hypothetical protein
LSSEASSKLKRSPVAYVQAIGFRDRLIGALGSALIFLVDQTDVAKHIAVESEDSREAIWHPVG